MALRLPIELPLFRRELTELAQRRRTYLIRVIGAIVMMTFVMYMINNVTQMSAMSTQQMMSSGAGISKFYGLGIGQAIFSRVVSLLFLMIPALLPALCCSAISAEKEQNTFGTLLLTRLSPGTIIMEKLLSRIVPMLTLLLLVSPVLAYVYSLGGVDPGMLFGAVWLLVCECFLFAALSLFFSAWFSSTVSAFIWSYVGAGILLVIGIIFPLTAFGAWRNHQLGLLGAMFSQYGAGTATSSGQLFFALVVRSFIPLFISLMLLVATRIVIVRRAFVGHSSVLLSIFRRLDQFFKNLNSWTTGGIELVAESNALPANDPVTWRERNKKSLGQFRWLVRILLVLEGPTVFICASAAVFTPWNSNDEAMWSLLILLWVFSAILAAVKGASLFAQERSRQTLEPLLSTPLTSRELIEQKVNGTNRLLLVLACPIMTVYLTQAYMFWRGDFVWTMAYLAVSTLLLFVVLRTVLWITCAVGIWVRSQTKAVTVSLIVVVLLGTTPILPAIMLIVWMGNPNGLAYKIAGLNGPAAIALVETAFHTNDGTLRFAYQANGWSSTLSYVPVEQVIVPAIVFQLAWLLIARWFVLRVAPRLLNRLDENHSTLTLSVRHSHG